MFGAKLVIWLGLGAAISSYSSFNASHGVESGNAAAYRQFEHDDAVPDIVRDAHRRRNAGLPLAYACWAGLGVLSFWGDAARLVKATRSRKGAPATMAVALLAVGGVGCYRPFEPIELKTVGTSEEGFLIPLRGDGTQQSSTTSEEDLKRNLVHTKQVQIPQQWVQKGYETFGANGSWQPAAVLVVVDRAPVTREWTADPTSGTSDKNEAIWVMTSDQVEFSTGWTCTARIATKEDAIKFLHNYPSGSLKAVMDGEIRAKLQAAFGLEVTDLPMDQLRKAATPHIQSVITEVTSFFKERGIQVTNMGITGGFVYKDPSVLSTLVKVFNAEQDKNIAAAATATQEEKNKQLKMEAEGKAAALLLEKQAEADGIKAVADAKAYEIEKAAEQGEVYVQLKRLDLEREKLKVWDGKFPQFYMGGGSGNAPDMLLNIPTLATAK